MGRKARLPEPWQSLAAHHGGAMALAELLGVSYVTFWRWTHGLCSPSPENEAKVAALCDSSGLPLPAFRSLGVEDA